MANYSAIKAAVNAYIKANGRKEITGNILNAVLNAVIDSLGRYFQFAGGAMPTDDPGTPDQNVCYLATEPGLYTHFNNIRILNEEVALLFWDGTWRKNSILMGIREVDANVDNNSGTPSVDVSYSQGRLVLSFHNLKGEPGDTGEPAGFGTIAADITGGAGTPGVSVESSGDNTSKNLMFHFTNLKGEAGVTSVVATIDDTSGLPSCQVSLVNGVLTLAFSGLKGLKGDTGVSADYPITIYNGLDSDATDMALAAAQGKFLNEKINQKAQEADDKIRELRPNMLRDSDGEGLQIADPQGYVGLTFKNGELDVTGVGENLEGIIKEIADVAIEESDVVEERAEQVVKTSELTLRLVQEDGVFVVDPAGYIGAVLFGEGGEEKTISVNVNLEQKNASFLSDLSSKYLVKNSIRWAEYESVTENPVMNFAGTSIIDKDTSIESVVNQESDNICPIAFTKYENLGGNHGFATKKVVCDISSLGYSAIGKQLSCNGRECYIVRIVADGVFLFPGHVGDTFNSLPVNSGDIITGDGVSISVTSVSTMQMFPSCVSQEKKLTIDGETIVESGDYFGNDVRFIDTYDIFDPISFLDKIIANAGHWTANPTIATAHPDFLVRRSLMYKFEKGGLCLIYDNFSILKDTSIDSEYGLNIKPMYTASVNGVKKYYLPKSLPLVYDKTTGRKADESTLDENKVTFDFRIPTTQSPAAIPGFSSLGDVGLWFAEDDCEDGNPIERGICILDFTDGSILMQHGYAPGFPVSGDDRFDYAARPWRMRVLNDFWTIYPQAYRSGSASFPGQVSKGETFGYVCFRKYADGMNDLADGVISTFSFRMGGNFYMYVDILTPGMYKMDIPSDCYGKKVDVLYKRDNVSVMEAVTTDCINISVSTSESGVNYGYCLIKI